MFNPYDVNIYNSVTNHEMCLVQLQQNMCFNICIYIYRERDTCIYIYIYIYAHIKNIYLKS